MVLFSIVLDKTANTNHTEKVSLEEGKGYSLDEVNHTLRPAWTMKKELNFSTFLFVNSYNNFSKILSLASE